MKTSLRSKPVPDQVEKKPFCFRSEQRFFCHQKTCPLRRECMKLVAEWRR